MEESNKEVVLAEIKDDMDFAVELAGKIFDLVEQKQFHSIDKMIEDLDFSELNTTRICCYCRYMARFKKHLRMFDYLLKNSIQRLKDLDIDYEGLLKGVI